MKLNEVRKITNTFFVLGMLCILHLVLWTTLYRCHSCKSPRKYTMTTIILGMNKLSKICIDVTAKVWIIGIGRIIAD